MLEQIIIGLLIVTIVLIILSIYLLYQRGQQISNLPQTEPLSFEQTQNAIKVLTNEDVINALNASLTKQGISEKIGTFTTLSSNMKESIGKFNQIVAQKSKRAKWGEWHLEEELKETFPNVKIREFVKELGNTPDAHMRTPDGKILIVDSKFVYDTYNEIQEAPETSGVGEVGIKKLQTIFRNDVKGHVKKIKSDYVQPGKGTHESAYMYIPSMAVYEYLIEHESATVRWAASEGVVICSPVNLMANMYMIEIVRMAQNMATLSNEILDAHLRIQNSFEKFDEEYKTLNTHIDRTFNKKNEVASLVNKMNSDINVLSSLDKSIEDTPNDE